MGLIKPYNIANYAEKNSIALAYLSENKKGAKKGWRGRRRPSYGSNADKGDRNFMSEG